MEIITKFQIFSIPFTTQQILSTKLHLEISHHLINDFLLYPSHSQYFLDNLRIFLSWVFLQKPMMPNIKETNSIANDINIANNNQHSKNITKAQKQKSASVETSITVT